MDCLYSRIIAFFCRYIPSRPIIHIDNPLLTYAAKELSDRYVWKTGGHVIDIISHSVGLSNIPRKCVLYFNQQEQERIDQLIIDRSLSPFITIEPNTNMYYSGRLRAWQFENWQVIIHLIRECYPALNIVQVGVKGGAILDNVISLVGCLSFRETALLIKNSCYFLGTDGGLMHAANAVNTRAVIVWGGTTLPEFIGYPEQHEVICKYVDCAPCGFKGHCPNGHKCMTGISVSEVWDVIRKAIATQCANFER